MSGPPDFYAEARRLRRQILRLHHQAHSGHIGSSLSCVEILTVLVHGWLRLPEDHCFLSKGHASTALYAALHARGILSDADLASYYRDGTRLGAHPTSGFFDEIPLSTGSLGHAVSVAAGLAWADALEGRERRHACVVSDGECNSGSFWEALMFLAHHRLNQVAVLVDANGLQAFGRTEEVLDLEPLGPKFAAFGLATVEVDGHDSEAILRALRAEDARPKVVICRTTKGKGVSFMENKLEWHYLPMSEADYAQALLELADESVNSAKGSA